MLAIVIDPVRTMASGKIDIGAFRCFPLDYAPPGETALDEQVIPMDKIEDWGVHYKRYYSLDVTFFMNNLEHENIEVLWNKYWINTIT